MCSECQNYNFQGRNKCNRCLKHKTRTDYNGKPKHILRHQNKAKQDKRVPDATPSRQDMGAATGKNGQESSPVATKLSGKEAKAQEERVGDWVCIKCANLNFSFRMTCNRCHRDRAPNESVLSSADDLERFQTAGGPAQYIMARSCLNSSARCFQPTLGATQMTEAKAIDQQPGSSTSEEESVQCQVSKSE